MRQYIRLFIMLGMLNQPVINPDNVLPGDWFIPTGPRPANVKVVCREKYPDVWECITIK